MYVISTSQYDDISLENVQFHGNTGSYGGGHSEYSIENSDYSLGKKVNLRTCMYDRSGECFSKSLSIFVSSEPLSSPRAIPYTRLPVLNISDGAYPRYTKMRHRTVACAFAGGLNLGSFMNGASTTSTPCLLSQCSFTSNQATEGGGGLSVSSPMVMASTLIAENTAAWYGGGLRLEATTAVVNGR